MKERMTQEDLAIFRESVQRMAKEKIAPLAEEIDEEGVFPWKTMNILIQNDLLSLVVPKQYGGSEAGMTALAVATEEISRVCGNTAQAFNSCCLASTPIIIAGSEDQKKKYLPLMSRGEKIASFALTEPGSGSDVASNKTTALADGDGYVINGKKCFITNGDTSTLYTLFATTNPKAAGVKGMSAFLVERNEKDKDTFSIGRSEKKIGGSAAHAVELFFENHRVPKSALLGEEGKGFYYAMKTLDKGRISIAAASVGKAQGALDLAIAYAKERIVFKQPVAKYQGIQWMIAEMATKIEAARQLTYHAAKILDEGKGDVLPNASAMAKLFATDVAMEVTTKALQIHGGYGYMKDYPIQRYWREAKLSQIVEGTNEIQKNIIARNLIGRL